MPNVDDGVFVIRAWHRVPPTSGAVITTAHRLPTQPIALATPTYTAIALLAPTTLTGHRFATTDALAPLLGRQILIVHDGLAACAADIRRFAQMCDESEVDTQIFLARTRHHDANRIANAKHAARALADERHLAFVKNVVIVVERTNMNQALNAIVELHK